jgi:rare lipoprotein A
MKSTTFRTARRRVRREVRRFSAGVLFLGLALTASAKDGTPAGGINAADFDAGVNPAIQIKPTAKPAAKTAKTRRWYQIGLASWYGQQFQGRRTAAGENFDMNSMTCAHPTLPMGTWLRVTNLKNRRTTFVRVNDRGPVFDGRIVDLSHAAAKVLGIAGVANVRLDAVREGDSDLANALVAQTQMPTLFALITR